MQHDPTSSHRHALFNLYPWAMLASTSPTGCPVSPLLLSMLITVLLSDASDMIPRGGTAVVSPLVTDLIYADIMHCITDVGMVYRMRSNWKGVGFCLSDAAAFRF